MANPFQDLSQERIPFEDTTKEAPSTLFIDTETACGSSREIVRCFLGLLSVLALFKLVSLAWQDLDFSLVTRVFPDSLPTVFSNWATGSMSPIACNWHNDYLSRGPLNSAFAAGCISVETDIWLSIDNDLLVGHSPHALANSQTLDSVYLGPLLGMLQRHNRRLAYLPPDTDVSGENIAGVFASDPTRSLVLLINFKEDGERLWHHLVKHLEPLRQGGYLTYYNGSAVIQRPVTIVASGKAPFNRILEQIPQRDIFYDVSLNELILEEEFPFNMRNSYYASANFHREIGTINGNRLSLAQLAKIRRHVKRAHELGLKVRYWGTPTRPRTLQNYVQHVLIREGVDLITVDDLWDATSHGWQKHLRWWS